MNTPKNILVVRTDRIGDVVLTLPMANLIKKNYPNSELVFMVRKYTSPLVQNNKFIDDLIIYDEAKNFSALLNEIKKFNFDSAIVVHPSFRIARLIFLAKINTRIGTGFRWYSFLFNKKLYVHRKYGTKHELVHNIELLKFFGIDEEIREENAEFGICVSEEKSKKIKEVFDEYKIDKSKPIIIIHPGSGGSAVDFPIEGFKDLVSYLSTLDVELILTGTKKEFNICEKISSSKTKNFAGKFNLEELISLINETDVLIANSTGPIHIAASLKKFVVGFYPKFPAASPVRWGPFTNRKLIFTPDIDCRNCTRKQCERTNCMKSISAKEVFEKLKKVLYSEFSPEN